jgi:HEAT repeat protein
MKHAARLTLLTLTVVLLLSTGNINAQVQSPAEIAKTIESLSAKDLNVRRAAVNLMAARPDIRYLGVLVRALSDNDQNVRQRAAVAIRSIPDPRADNAARNGLKHADSIVRRELLHRFSGRATPEAVRTLAAMLDDRDHEVRNQAASLLNAIQHDDAMAALRRVINHFDPRVRIHAVMNLERKLTAESVSPLVGRINDIDTQIRQRAVQLLRRIPDSAADRALMSVMQDTDAYVRQQAAEHFGNPAHQQRTPGSIGPLTKALSDLDQNVRERAATALRVSQDSRADGAMLGALNNVDANVRRHALQRFHDHPEKKIIDPLIKSLGDFDRANRDLAARALDRIDDPRAKAAAKSFRERKQNIDKNKLLAEATTPAQIRKLLTHVEDDLRHRAAEKLRRLAGDEATRAAIAAYDNRDVMVRRHMIERFREKPHPSAIPTLAKALNDLDNHNRHQAAHALLAAPGPSATQAMLAGMRNPDSNVRYLFVVRFRDKIEAKAVSALTLALNDKQANVRRESAQALRRIDDEAAVRAAIANFTHPDVEVRNHFIHRFAEKPHAAAFGPLLKTLHGNDSRTWGVAAHAVRRYAGEEATKAAFALLDHQDANVRTNAIARFQEKPHADSVKAFVKCLNDGDQNVRRQAASGLQTVPGEEATLAALAAMNHPDHEVRYRLAARFITQPDDRAVPQLVKAIDDPHNSVRHHAGQAIARSASGDRAKLLVPLLYRPEAGLRHVTATKFKSYFMDPTLDKTVLPTGSDILVQMESMPPIPCESPKVFVEMIGGDRIVGEVVGYVPKVESTDKTLPYVEVKPTRLAVLPAHYQDDPLEVARVYTRWIRRIVWESRGKTRFVPGMAYLRNGAQIEFRSLRWEPDTVVVLDQDRIKRILIRDIAELHMPIDDPWTAYYEQLAVLGCRKTDRLTRLNYDDGTRVTVCADRLLPFFEFVSNEPNDWKHGVRPAWCADALAAKHRSIAVRYAMTPDEVPLFSPDNRHSSYDGLWPWQADRNVNGGQLRCGDEQYEWGFGVHADSVLSFRIPNIATQFRSQFGLDAMVGTRGCARTFVRLQTSDRVTKLYQSPVLIGSASSIDTGTVTLPKLDGDAKLELVADSAHRDRPSGADPLNIRDMVDWLEPRLKLNAAQLEMNVVEAAAMLDPAWFKRESIVDQRAVVRRLWEAGQKAVVSYTVEDRHGLGVLVGTEGHVLTAGHILVHGGLDVSVQLYDGRSFAGKTLGIYRDADLGLIGIGVQADLSGLKLSGDGELARRDMFLHIAHTEPNAAKPRWFPNVATIIDDGLGIRTFRSQFRLCTLGGPVLDKYGKVVGIHTGSGMHKHTQFCRVYRALHYWDRLTAGEEWGQWLIWSTPRIGIISTGSQQGARVDRIDPGSPAERAGLKVGDVIIEMDGQKVLSYIEMEPIKSHKNVGDTVKLSVRRGAQTIQMTVSLMPR